MSNVTMNVQFADNPAFLEYIDLLVQTQHAICRGDNQTADRLCDASEDLGKHLSVAEIQWLQWLSSDLEMLCDEELLQPVEQTEDTYARSMTQAWLDIEEEPERVLELLRHNRGFMSQAQVAAARARAYEILGYKNIRQEFLRCAVRLDPQNVMCKLLLLDEAGDWESLSEVLELVETIFNGPASEPFVSLTAAGTAFMHTRFLSPAEARPILGRLRGQVERVLNQDRGSALEPEVAVFGLLLLGRISESLNRKSAAKEYYSRALSLDPQADEALLALGSLLVESDPKKAFPLFERAVVFRTLNALPYLVLALKELHLANYQQAMSLAEQVLVLKTSPKLRAYTCEILGLSELGSAGITTTALRYLEEALSLAPDNNGMKNNYEEALNLFYHRKEGQANQQVETMLESFDVQSVLSEADVRSKGFLSERLTNLSILSSKDESSQLAFAA